MKLIVIVLFCVVANIAQGGENVTGVEGKMNRLLNLEKDDENKKNAEVQGDFNTCFKDPNKDNDVCFQDALRNLSFVAMDEKEGRKYNKDVAAFAQRHLTKCKKSEDPSPGECIRQALEKEAKITAEAKDFFLYISEFLDLQTAEEKYIKANYDCTEKNSCNYTGLGLKNALNETKAILRIVYEELEDKSDFDVFFQENVESKSSIEKGIVFSEDLQDILKKREEKAKVESEKIEAERKAEFDKIYTCEGKNCKLTKYGQDEARKIAENYVLQLLLASDPKFVVSGSPDKISDYFTIDENGIKYEKATQNLSESLNAKWEEKKKAITDKYYKCETNEETKEKVCELNEAGIKHNQNAMEKMKQTNDCLEANGYFACPDGEFFERYGEQIEKYAEDIRKAFKLKDEESLKKINMQMIQDNPEAFWKLVMQFENELKEKKIELDDHSDPGMALEGR